MITALDAETITVSTSAVKLTASKLTHPNVNKVIMYIEGSLRYWSSGLAPTSSTGMILVDELVQFDLPEASELKMIRSGGSDAKVHVQYYQERNA